MKQSAGILLYKIENEIKILLAHPGGPFWSKKEDGAWTIPKGELNEAEDPLTAARREFFEETGQAVNGKFIKLTPLKQKGGKIIQAWALKGDMETTALISNTFEMEWPPRSEKKQTFPEIDRVKWFTVKEALLKILTGQQGFILELEKIIKGI